MGRVAFDRLLKDQEKFARPGVRWASWQSSSWCPQAGCRPLWRAGQGIWSREEGESGECVGGRREVVLSGPAPPKCVVPARWDPDSEPTCWTGNSVRDFVLGVVHAPSAFLLLPSGHSSPVGGLRSSVHSLVSSVPSLSCLWPGPAPLVLPPHPRTWSFCAPRLLGAGCRASALPWVRGSWATEAVTGQTPGPGRHRACFRACEPAGGAADICFLCWAKPRVTKDEEGAAEVSCALRPPQQLLLAWTEQWAAAG